MSKGNLNLGDFQKLSKEEQRNVSGSLSAATTCNTPYFISNGVCEPGDFPHPTLGHCVCCSA